MLLGWTFYSISLKIGLDFLIFFLFLFASFLSCISLHNATRTIKATVRLGNGADYDGESLMNENPDGYSILADAHVLLATHVAYMSDLKIHRLYKLHQRSQSHNLVQRNCVRKQKICSNSGFLIIKIQEEKVKQAL